MNPSAATGSVFAACTWAAISCSVRTNVIPPSPFSRRIRTRCRIFGVFAQFSLKIHNRTKKPIIQYSRSRIFSASRSASNPCKGSVKSGDSFSVPRPFGRIEAGFQAIPATRPFFLSCRGTCRTDKKRRCSRSYPLHRLRHFMRFVILFSLFLQWLPPWLRTKAP